MIINDCFFADVRFHSSPVVDPDQLLMLEGNDGQRINSHRGSVPEHILLELRKSLAVPVSERRKFFEMTDRR
jgi:hypothetical protein